ncbi:biotin-dependent carboxyltransferase family protein [Kitasatospora phosalacinea]|uniref:5-oxoprolinase subunit C family protein n=1 Tax=Kitasatospora phosalacinea TaxID=2065 RepID=UPI0035D6BF2C
MRDGVSGADAQVDAGAGPAVLLVVRAGYGATVQDLGRPGLAALGVGRSGAADRGALRLANRLVGNPEGAAGLEMPLGGVELEFSRAATCALAGADCPAWVDGRPVGPRTPLAVPAGARLRIGTPGRGLRAYLAVRGGLDVPAVLGSRATDTLAGLGPQRLTAGQLLPVGTAATGWPAAEHAPRRDRTGPVVLHVVPGPRDDWFTPAALRTLCGEPYTVTADSDRVGMRLDGPVLERARGGELPSEGMVGGALQVPPSGRPILFLADHPVTGGYPVIAVVRRTDLDAAAQARPGDVLRFRLD